MTDRLARWRARSSAFLPALRRLGLAPLAEAGLRTLALRQAASENARFRRDHHGLPLPPPALVFETQGHASFATFLASGQAAASALHERVAPFHPADRRLVVLDWGAGAGRLLRWWPSMAPDWRVSGAEPLAQARHWLARSGLCPDIARVRARPPLPFPAARFDLIYGVSVLTHIPRAAQDAWIAELRRLLAPGGLLALTLHGRAAQARLSPAEHAALAGKGYVERRGAADGARLFAVYSTAEDIRGRLLAGFEILRHEENSPVANGGQDLWLCRAR